jgi:hypothetical protein
MIEDDSLVHTEHFVGYFTVDIESIFAFSLLNRRYILREVLGDFFMSVRDLDSKRLKPFRGFGDVDITIPTIDDR